MKKMGTDIQRKNQEVLSHIIYKILDAYKNRNTEKKKFFDDTVPSSNQIKVTVRLSQRGYSNNKRVRDIRRDCYNRNSILFVTASML